jgi:hypothetical protein
MDIKDFKNGKDEREKMGIGLRHRVDQWLEEHSIDASSVESEIVDGNKVFYIDVEGDVWLEKFNLDDVANIPKYIRFRHVTGKFILGNSK